MDHSVIIEQLLKQNLTKSDNGKLIDQEDNVTFETEEDATLYELLKSRDLNPKYQLDKGTGHFKIYVKALGKAFFIDKEADAGKISPSSEDKKKLYVNPTDLRKDNLSLFDDDLSETISFLQGNQQGKKDQKLDPDEILEKVNGHNHKKHRSLYSYMSDALDQMARTKAPWASKKFLQELQKKAFGELRQDSNGKEAFANQAKANGLVNELVSKATIPNDGQMAFRAKPSRMSDSNGEITNGVTIDQTRYDKNGKPIFSQSLGQNGEISKVLDFNKQPAKAKDLVPLPENDSYFRFSDKGLAKYLNFRLHELGINEKITDSETAKKFIASLRDKKNQNASIIKKDIASNDQNIGVYTIQSDQTKLDPKDQVIISSNDIADIVAEKYAVDKTINPVEIGKAIESKTKAISKNYLNDQRNKFLHLTTLNQNKDILRNSSMVQVPDEINEYNTPEI